MKTVQPAVAAMILGGLGLSGAFSGKAAAQRPEAASAKQESPLACNRLALTPEQRKRHFEEVGPALRARKKGVQSLADGYEFEFPGDAETFRLAAEWAGGEHVCCPFFEISLHLAPEGGPLRIRVTGRDGVKQFMEADGAAWLKQ
jgi:hypothetical protein